MILKRVIKTGNQVTRRVCRYRLWSLLFPSSISAPESVRVCVFSSGVTETCGQGSVLKNGLVRFGRLICSVGRGETKQEEISIAGVGQELKYGGPGGEVG